MAERAVILSLGISLDGYIARRNGAVDFLTMDPEYDWGAFINQVDTWLLGRKTLEDTLKLHGGGKLDSMGLQTIVFSRSMKPGAADGFEVTGESPRDVVARLRKQPGKHIWLGGGGELVRSFLEADLVDRLEIGMVPVLIGDGLPLFPPGFSERRFRLLQARTYSRTGLLTVSYERARRR